MTNPLPRSAGPPHQAASTQTGPAGRDGRLRRSPCTDTDVWAGQRKLGASRCARRTLVGHLLTDRSEHTNFARAWTSDACACRTPGDRGPGWCRSRLRVRSASSARDSSWSQKGWGMGELKVSVQDGIALALMSSTKRHNAQDTPMHADLCKFWTRLRDDDSLRIAVLAGDGDSAFSVGADLKEAAEAYSAGQAPNSPQRSLGYPHLHPTGKIVIAAINGYCLAGGLLTALGCDLRFCSKSATFANPQVMRGRGSRVPMLLRRAGVPLAVTVDMAITGQRIDASRAYEIGLVSRIYDDKDALIEGAMSVAAQILDNSPRAVNAVKRALDAGILDWPMALADKVWDQVTDAMIKDEDTVRRTVEFASHSGADRKKI